MALLCVSPFVSSSLMFLLPSQWYNGTVIIISTSSSSSAQTRLGVRVVVGVELWCPPGPSHSWHWSITEPSSTTTTLPDSHSAQKVFVIVILVSIIIGILVPFQSYILICMLYVSLSVVIWKGSSWMFVRVSNVLPIRKKIFVISKVQFHHEGGLNQSRYLSYFS